MLAPNGYSQKVVAGELANDAREARAAVEDLRCDLLFQARRRLKGLAVMRSRSHKRRVSIVPGPEALEGGAGSEHSLVGEPPPDDL
jgi:hypothetical protein